MLIRQYLKGHIISDHAQGKDPLGTLSAGLRGDKATTARLEGNIVSWMTTGRPKSVTS